MKKSLIIRWVVIALVILVWTWAMFPIKDKDFRNMFETVSRKNVAKLQTEAKAFIDEKKVDPAELIKKVTTIEDQTNQEFKDANEKLNELRADKGFAAWRQNEDYQELIKRLNLIDLKVKYETAAAHKAQMDSIAQKDSADYKFYEEQYKAITEEPGYKKWTESIEYKELERRLPVNRMKAQLEQFADKTSEAYHKLAADYKTASEALNTVPADIEADPAKKAEYEDSVRHLSLIYDVERSISGFKALEKAANGNSDLYRLSLSDFVKVPFYGNTSNKNVLRYIRTKSAGKLHLGLDLKGGTEFVLDFDMREAEGLMVTDKTMQNFVVDYLNDTAKYAKDMPEALAKSINDFAAENTAMDKQDIARAVIRKAELAASLRQFLTEHTNLLRKQERNAYGSVTDIRDRILNIMENRLNSMGVTEPEIKASGENTISVRMPSVDEADKNEIRNTIKKAAKLEFFLVATNNDDLVAKYESDRQSFKTPAGVIRTEIETELANGSVSYTPVFLEAEPTPVKGEDVERAFPTTDEFGRWVISLKFNSAGTVTFGDVTSKNVGRLLAIVLDGKVYSAPRLREAIRGGQAQISGSFTLEEAKRLASVIASGNVPVTVNIGSEFGTDPTLGRDSVESGTIAGIIGLAIVVLFMLFYYRWAGFVAICALTVNTILVLGTMAIFKATITMPGIAGMVLTIGMAVDANVIIYERIREELAAKASITNAINAGYDKAFSAIFDSNLTTLLTCLFLYWQGTGSIKGFAVTLGCGIIASMFTAIFMTRAIFDLLIFKDVIKDLKMYIFGFFKSLNIRYLDQSKKAITISVVLIVISLLAFAIKGRNMFGIDFTGGTEMSYECQGTAPNVDAIREFLKSEKYSDNVRVGYKRGQSGERLLEIVLPSIRENGVEKQIDYTEFNSKLDSKFPDVKISLKQTNTVGANVGSQFKSSAFWAAFWSVLGIICYLAFRFEFRYGVAATIAVVHDALISAGLFVICGGNISLTVVAALMTIMGYSLNDTIVIFDRVRETMAATNKMTYSEIINKSINDCMSRTIITSLTTMLVVLSLLIIGGGAVRDFALVMFFGVIVGTYSSIFISNTIINRWHKTTLSMKKAEEKAKLAAQQALKKPVAPSKA